MICRFEAPGTTKYTCKECEKCKLYRHILRRKEMASVQKDKL